MFLGSLYFWRIQNSTII